MIARPLCAVMLCLLAVRIAGQGAWAAPAIKHVVVIAMENTDARDIYGNTRWAPYINTRLLPHYARAENFTDPLTLGIQSEPHYVWMEAGTNVFSGHSFTTDRDASEKNSTTSTRHLVTQIERAGHLTWMTYQEGIVAGSHLCPIRRVGKYAAKHNPFIFFQDISGSPPDRGNAHCAAHHRPFAALAKDMSSGRLANYVFITPNICHDMHNACDGKGRIRSGDSWLAEQLPPIIKWANANSAVIFIVWDEGEKTLDLPFFAIGPGIKPNFAGRAHYDHGSLVKTVEVIFGLPVLPAVARNKTFSNLFRYGYFP